MFKTLIAAGITSLPIPSPAITAMRCVFIVSRWARLRLRLRCGRLWNVLGRSVWHEVPYKPVLFVDRNHTRLDRLVGQAERHDDHLVAGMKVTRRGAVDDDLARTARQTDRVGIDAGAVVDVPDRDPLAGNDVRAVEEILIDADAADVIDVRAGDDGAVNLGLQDGA